MRALCLALLMTSSALAQCSQFYKLYQRGPLDIGVRWLSSDIKPYQIEALNKWQEIIRFTWRETAGSDCSISFQMGPASFFVNDEDAMAMADLPHTSEWEGRIYVRPDIRKQLDGWQIEQTMLHEIGHEFGLTHNRDDLSIMTMCGYDRRQSLDLYDLLSLSKLRCLVGEQCSDSKR